MRPATATEQLLQNTDRVLDLWEQGVRREIAAARDEAHAILIDTLPVLLQQLAEALTPNHPRRTATDGSTVAHEHGGERVRVTRFSLEDVIAEYKVLRRVLCDVLEESHPLSAEERHTLHSSLDQMIIEACTAYSLVQSTQRDRVFATIAHDLRNPLNSAQMAASAIVSQPHAPHVPDWAERIMENVQRIDRMLQEVLDTIRAQSGRRLPIELEFCDLVGIVRRTVDRMQIEPGGRLRVSAPEPVPGYFAPSALERAVENLIDNALKYGEPSRPITVTVRGSHGRAILSVHNHGAPIPIEQQETLFRAFQRLTSAEASRQRGWGLGLAQARAVAEAHGGSIGVDSLPQTGTTFTIDMPLDARPYRNSSTTNLPGA